MDRPIVKKGNAGDAGVASNNDRLSIHIIGRKDTKRSPKEYAIILANAFADRKFTDHPVYITVTYENRNTSGQTLASIFMDGGRYKTNEGHNVFTPEQIGKSIKAICKRYVEIYGDKHIIKKGTTLNLLPLTF